MRRASRIALILVAFLVLLLVVAAVAVFVLVRSPFPDTDGAVTLEGLQAEVDVYRDNYGVPHIYAENEHDLFFAQGYVHAQDRFWQMEWSRHVGQGRLSEIVGEDALEPDRFIRTVGFNRMAADTLDYYEREAPEAIAILEAYSAGVNTYLQREGGSFSINRTILEQVRGSWEIEPWEPLDTVSWTVVMAYELSDKMRSELTRAELNRVLGEATTSNLLPTYPYDRRPVIAPTDDLANRDELLDETEDAGLTPPASRVDWQRVNTNLVGELPPDGLAFGGGLVGSNNWAVSGEHTASGLPLLANDPHLGIQMPSIWYEVHLNAPGWNVTGFSFPGVPAVVIGHNDRIAWGVTNVGPDVQDLYVEKINPSNPRQYEFEGEWREMDVVEEVIRVNGGEDVALDVLLTHHGPIVSDVLDGTGDPLSLRWTIQEPNGVLQSVLLLNQAEDYDDFREALRYFDAPSQNFVYADVEGNIAYQTPGRIPIRENGDGLVPVPGWTGEYEWEGYIPFEELPALFNPDQGYIVTANNAVVDEEYPYFLSHYWASGDRAQRVVELLEAAIERGDVTADDFARVQMDGKSLLAESYRPLLQGLASDDPRVQAAIERLRGWDLQTNRDSVPAALFEIFYMHLAEAVLADELGEARDEYLSNGNVQRVFFHQLAREPGASWWDDVNTDRTETHEDVILQALTDTVQWFEENVGGEMEEWTWGELHTATFVSEPLGQSGIGIIEALVNRGPYPVDGSTSAVNANSWGWESPAAVGGHPSLRMIVDMSDLDASRGIHSTGQSGHPYHRHYDDFVELWQNGEYHPMFFTRETVEEATDDHLVLQPAGD